MTVTRSPCPKSPRSKTQFRSDAETHSNGPAGLDGVQAEPKWRVPVRSIVERFAQAGAPSAALRDGFASGGTSSGVQRRLRLGAASLDAAQPGATHSGDALVGAPVPAQPLAVERQQPLAAAQRRAPLARAQPLDPLGVEALG